MVLCKPSDALASWAGVWVALILLFVMAELAYFAEGEIVVTAGIGVKFGVHCWAFDQNGLQRDYGTWDMSQDGMSRLEFSVSGMSPEMVLNCHFNSDQPDSCGEIYEDFPIFPQTMAMIDCSPFDCTWSVHPDGFYYTALTGQLVKRFKWLCGSSRHEVLRSRLSHG